MFVPQTFHVGIRGEPTQSRMILVSYSAPVSPSRPSPPLYSLRYLCQRLPYIVNTLSNPYLVFSSDPSHISVCNFLRFFSTVVNVLSYSAITRNYRTGYQDSRENSCLWSMVRFDNNMGNGLEATHLKSVQPNRSQNSRTLIVKPRIFCAMSGYQV